ncbi:MAG TPA: response regulator [Ktedonobacterales bacterium]|jgi:CheY-like chemotaxis protein|nr:response regulator [Ktedonobacterales bacterium]
MTTSYTESASKASRETPEKQSELSFSGPAQHKTPIWKSWHSRVVGKARRETPAARATVLVVDDEASITSLLDELLESAGYRVLVANTGQAALALARTVRPTLILTDCMMPGIDGPELARRLRGSPDTTTIPVVMMSSIRPRLVPRENLAELRAPEERIIRNVKRGVYLATVGDLRLLFVEKPFDLDTVLDVVQLATGDH